MAGVEKNIIFGNGFKLQPSAAGDIALTNHLATDISFLNITGSPAGVVSANPSSLTFDLSTGNIYRKASATDTTGWVLLNSTPVAAVGAAGTILHSNGTSWVATSNFLVDSNDIMTNTSQPAVLAYVHTPISNVTGDGTAYQVIFDSVPYQQGTNYNSGTGTFTVPVAGLYQVTGMITLTGLSASFTSAELNILSNAGTFSRQLFNPGLIRDSGNNLSIVFSGIDQYAVGNTIYIQITVNGGTKSVGLKPDSFGQYCYLNILKVA